MLDDPDNSTTAQPQNAAELHGPCRGSLTPSPPAPCCCDRWFTARVQRADTGQPAVCAYASSAHHRRPMWHVGSSIKEGVPQGRRRTHAGCMHARMEQPCACMHEVSASQWQWGQQGQSAAQAGQPSHSGRVLCPPPPAARPRRHAVCAAWVGNAQRSLVAPSLALPLGMAHAMMMMGHASSTQSQETARHSRGPLQHICRSTCMHHAMTARQAGGVAAA